MPTTTMMLTATAAAAHAWLRLNPKIDPKSTLTPAVPLPVLRDVV